MRPAQRLCEFDLMPPSWRAGLVNAFPIPDEKRKKRKGTKATHKQFDELTQPIIAEPSSDTTPPTPSFPFLLLPPEIRTRIYHLILFPPPRTPHTPKPPASHTNVNTLALLRTSHLIHSETTHLLYTRTHFPLFHIQNFPPLPTPLLIPPRHRSLLKSLHLRLGNSWSSPPKSWRVSKLLARALPKFTSLKTLKIFVEMDPSEPMFEKYRISDTFYTDFAGSLLRDVLQVVPQVESVEVGGYEFVGIHGPLVTRVVDVIFTEGRKLVWSEENGWRERAARGEEEKGAKQRRLELVMSLGRPELERLC